MANPFSSGNRELIGSKHVLILSLILISLVVGVLACLFDPVYPLLALAGLIIVALIMKYDYFGLIVYLIVFLFRPGETYTILNTVRIELVLGAALSFLVLLKNKIRYGHFTIPDSKLNLDFLLFMGVIVLSMPLSSCKDCTIDNFMNMLKLAIFYLLIILEVDSRKRLEVFFWFFIAINAILAFDITYGFYHGRAIFNQGLNRARGSGSAMDNFNGIAITMNTVIPFVYYLSFHYRAAWKKMLMGATLVLFIWTLIITGSRGGLLGFLSILGIIWWQSRRKFAMGVVILAFLIVGWFNVGADSQARYASILSDNLDASSENRVKAWMDGLELFMFRPITGVGAGAFAWARVERFGIYLNPHNLYIQVIAELGIFGVIVFFMFVIDIIRINIRTIKKARTRGSPNVLLEPFARATIISCCSLLVTGVFAHSTYRYTWYLMAALTVVSEHFIKKEERESTGEAMAEPKNRVASEISPRIARERN